ncbi:MAG TPA: hypothetical protein VE196_10865 [Pseudonocardiaceae bacterium]|jgi:hypothetical protein|nr:hypothetical protein [Pseudonocardiaceae bacterium]
MSGVVVARIVLQDRFGCLDPLDVGEFLDETAASAWALRQLDMLRWSGVWEHADECYVAKVVMPDGRTRTGYLCDRAATIDWDPGWDCA